MASNATRRYLLKILRTLAGDASVEEIATESGVPVYIVRHELAPELQKRAKAAQRPERPASASDAG